MRDNLFISINRIFIRLLVFSVKICFSISDHFIKIKIKIKIKLAILNIFGNPNLESKNAKSKKLKRFNLQNLYIHCQNTNLGGREKKLKDKYRF